MNNPNNPVDDDMHYCVDCGKFLDEKDEKESRANKNEEPICINCWEKGIMQAEAQYDAWKEREQ